MTLYHKNNLNKFLSMETVISDISHSIVSSKLIEVTVEVLPDFENKARKQPTRKCNVVGDHKYMETTSDSDDDSIFSLGIFEFDWLLQLKLDFEFDNKIRGLKTMIFIPANTILDYYGGKYINNKAEVKNIFKESNGVYYLVQCGSKLWIDGNPKFPESNILSYINHSCYDNNCSLERSTKRKVVIRTIRNILPEEFLHFDYNTIFLFKKPKILKCLCHSGCKNFLN